MKLLVSLALFVALALPSTSAHAEKKPNPADYTVPVHITACLYGAGNSLVMQAVINGKHFQLTGDSIRSDSTHFGLLHPGDYKARLWDHSDAKTDYLSYDQYELLLPDGHTLKAAVSGIYESTP